MQPLNAAFGRACRVQGVQLVAPVSTTTLRERRGAGEKLAEYWIRSFEKTPSIDE